jgi:hypothetical protein
MNARTLIAQLNESGIQYIGCNSERVWDANGDITNRADVAALIAANDAYTVTFLAKEAAAIARQQAARAHAKAIPSWSSWTEAEILSWIETNIGSPLTTGRANLPATLTLATTRIIFLAILDILDKMQIVLIALARMVVAMRNQTWPDLQDR